MSEKRMAETITKSAAARRWKISPAAVGKYVKAGMPVRNDGRLDWEIADQWRKQYVCPERSGNFLARQRTARAHSASPPPESQDDYAAGYAAARSDLREAMPILIAVNGDVKTLESRIRSFLTTDALLARWAEIYRIDGIKQLTEIDWSVCSAAIQKLASKTQREVNAEFAKIRARSL
jgi:hypothetical protein